MLETTRHWAMGRRPLQHLVINNVQGLATAVHIAIYSCIQQCIVTKQNKLTRKQTHRHEANAKQAGHRTAYLFPTAG